MSTDAPRDCQLLTVGELAERLRMSPRTIWRLSALSEARQGDGFPMPVTVGPRLRRWRVRDVEEYLDSLGTRSRK